jgi:hypothetical protein
LRGFSGQECKKKVFAVKVFCPDFQECSSFKEQFVHREKAINKIKLIGFRGVETKALLGTAEKDTKYFSTFSASSFLSAMH